MAIKAKAKTAQINKKAAEEGQLKPFDGMSQISAPLVSASSIQIVVAGNEATLIFLRSRPMAHAPQGNMAVALEATAMVQMSPQTLKDLSIVTTQTVSNIEKEWGEIETPFTRKRASSH